MKIVFPEVDTNRIAQESAKHFPEITTLNTPFPEKKHAFQAVNHLF